jgi:hypothetical protein
LGHEKSVFNHGENIVFSFKILNTSSEELVIQNFLNENADFFKLFRLDSNEGNLNYGAPDAIICSVGFFSIQANSTLEFKCPWVYSENANDHQFCLIPIASNKSYLPKGNYYTGFTQSFKIDDIQSEEVSFIINFTIN